MTLYEVFGWNGLKQKKQSLKTYSGCIQEVSNFCNSIYPSIAINLNELFPK